MVWLDVLDLHIVNMLDASFLDFSPDESQPVTRPEGAASRGSATISCRSIGSPTSRPRRSSIIPMRGRARRSRSCGVTAPDPYHGFRMRYINPVNGDWAMPTISTWMQLLPKGFSTRPYRSTDSTVFVVVEGEGESTIGGKGFAGVRATSSSRRAGFPSTRPRRRRDLQFSDRVVQEKLDFWREHRGNA